MNSIFNINTCILILFLFVNKQIVGELFRGLILYYNQQVQVNSKQNLLIVVESTGTKDVNLELHTPTYVITSFIFPKGGNVHYTEHLNVTCTNFGIMNPPNRPSNAAAYYVFIEAVFVQLGSDEMTLTAIDPDSQDEYFKKKYKIEAKTPLKHQCFPRIRFLDCASPHHLRKVALHQKVTIQPIVERSCGMNSRIKYDWRVNDFLDKETRMEFPDDKSRVLRIPAFKLWFNDQQTTFHTFYTINVKINEIRSNGSDSGIAIGRCYVAILTAPPVAKIKFGNYREVNRHKSISLDGSESQDMTSPSNGVNLLYRWSCSSTPKNPYCKNEMGNGQTLQIPANGLNINEKYTITLQVTSTRTIRDAKTSQIIMPTFNDPLLVSYICVRNCLNGVANAQNIIHIKAHCFNCNSSVTTYMWSLQQPKSKQFKNGPRLFLDPTKDSPNAKMLTVRLDARYEGRSGFIEFEIKITKFSKVGSCFVQPKEGIECSTEFRITCNNFLSEFEPLTYSLYQANQLLISQQNDEFKLLLSKSFNLQSANLRVEVSDTLHNIHTLELNVPLKSLEVILNSEGILNFIRSKTFGIDFNTVIASGDMSSIISKMQAAANYIKNLPNEGSKTYVTEEILSILRKLSLTTTEDIERISPLLNRLLSNLTLNNTLAEKTSQIFDAVSKSLVNNLKSGDIFDLTPEKNTNMTRSFIETAERFFKPAENFPQVHTFDIPRPEEFENENYPDYSELDFQIIYRIDDWMHFVNSTSRLFHKLSLVAFQINDATDEINIETKGVRWIMRLIAPEYTEDITQINAGSLVSIPSTLLKTFIPQNDPKAKVGVQMIFPINNPYWWYPDEHKISSHITTINIFSHKFNKTSFTVREVNSKFDIFFKIINQPDNKQTVETFGSVLPKKDMPIYQCTLPRNALIAFQFIKTGGAIKVLTKIGEIPKYQEMINSQHIIKNATRPIEYVGFNNGTEDSIAYIAIYPNDSQTNNSKIINFHFKSTIYTCNTWDTKNEKWDTNYCYAGQDTNQTHIHCECWHFSDFAARLFKTPNSIELPRNVVTALGANLVFLVVYILIMLISLGLIFWAKNRDEEDKVKSGIFYIEPYNPKKSYIYLVSISTGNFKYSGTTARISIELIGSNLISDKYILSARTLYGAFKRNSETTFALRTKQNLGIINSIILTNDYSGRYPSWYCNLVRVKDPARKEEFIFLVDRWLSKISHSPLRIEVDLATEKQLSNIKYVSVEHFKRCFRDFCTWYGLLSPSHRGSLIRIEKAIILVTSFSFAAMLSIIFFQRTTLDNIEEERVQYSRFILTFSNVLHSTICSVLAALLAMTIIGMFMKSKKAAPTLYKTIYADEKLENFEEASNFK